MRVRHKLEAHGRRVHIRVAPLSQDGIAEYFADRVRWADLPGVALQFHNWTGGITLFSDVLLNDLIDPNRLILADRVWVLSESVQRNAPPVAPRIRHIIE